MKKIQKILCCAECTAHTTKSNISYCKNTDRRIDEDSENPVNIAFIGFPEWCPLETLDNLGKLDIDFKKEIMQIVKIAGNCSNPDSIVEASHYLNEIVENAKKTA